MQSLSAFLRALKITEDETLVLCIFYQGRGIRAKTRAALPSGLSASVFDIPVGGING